jgi:hypothetical protein
VIWICWIGSDCNKTNVWNKGKRLDAMFHRRPPLSRFSSVRTRDKNTLSNAWKRTTSNRLKRDEIFESEWEKWMRGGVLCERNPMFGTQPTLEWL